MSREQIKYELRAVVIPGPSETRSPEMTASQPRPAREMRPPAPRASRRARRERLEIGADLVRHIALRGDAVGADDRDVDLVVLHQVPAGIVRDHGVRNAVLAELPGGERSALIARARLVDPDMNRNALLVR